MKIWTHFIKKREYDIEKINFKHNLWRITNDLNWLWKNSDNNDLNTQMCLYWLDINLKNTIFPWILKIERELKASFIYFYKKKFNTTEINELLKKENYNDLENSKNPLKMLNEKKLEDKSIDETIFTLTFGEFVYLVIYFHDSIKNQMSKSLNMNLTIFVNIIKYFIILRNAIAHNKTIIKIKDEKNNKRFSLKKNLFDFSIQKNEIDIISTNASGSIYVVKLFLMKLDSRKKAKIFIKDIKDNIKVFYKTMKNKKEYKRIMNLIFLKYQNEILKI